MIDIVGVYLAEAFAESALYGIFLILASTALVLHIRRRTPRSITHAARPSALRLWASVLWRLRSEPLAIVNVVYLVTVTAHLVLSARRVVVSVLTYGNGEAAAQFLTNLQDRAQIARLSLLFFNMFLADLVLAYRVWITWQRSLWISILPMLTVIGVLISGSGMVYQSLNPQGGVFTKLISPWIAATCTLTVCNNVYSTLVIAWRVWKSTRLLKTSGLNVQRGRSLLQVIAIFVESAALWTICVIIYMSVYLAGSWLEAIGTGCGPVMIGITFTLITVRVGLRRNSDSQDDTSGTQPWAAASGAPSASAHTQRGLNHHPMQSFSITMGRSNELDPSADVWTSDHAKVDEHPREYGGQAV